MDHTSIYAVVALLTLPLAAASLFAADAVPPAGQPAPGFTLPSQDGSKIALNRPSGQVGGVVLLSPGQHAGLHHRSA